MSTAPKDPNGSFSWEAFLRGLLGPLVRLLIRLRVSPDTLTLIGFAISLTAAGAFAVGWIHLAGAIMLVGGLFDTLDGEVARASRRGSAFGAFLDSTLDRLSEAAIFAGIIYWMTISGAPLGAFLSVLALTFSFLTSYTRARAEGLGYDCKVGTVERPHRVVVLAVFSLSGFVEVGVALVAAGALITTFQRILHVRRVSRLP